MATYLMVRGLEPVEIEESFNLARQRVNEVVTGTNRDGSMDYRQRPLHKVTFKTKDNGRFAPVPQHILGVGSDMPNDKSENGTGDDYDEEEFEEDEDDE